MFTHHRGCTIDSDSLQCDCGLDISKRGVQQALFELEVESDYLQKWGCFCDHCKLKVRDAIDHFNSSVNMLNHYEGKEK